MASEEVPPLPTARLADTGAKEKEVAETQAQAIPEDCLQAVLTAPSAYAKMKVEEVAIR